MQLAIPAHPLLFFRCVDYVRVIGSGGFGFTDYCGTDAPANEILESSEFLFDIQ